MLEDIIDFLKSVKVYALGRGILTLAVFAAGAIGTTFTSIGFMPAILVASIGGVALTAVSRLHDQRVYEDTMVDLYRYNIAKQLQIAPEEVTRSDLREAAKENTVIKSALDRQRKKTFLTITTAVAASLVSVLALGVFDVGESLLKSISTSSFSGMLPLLGYGGVTAVCAASSLIIHNGLDAAIGYSAGIEQASANDMIMKMHTRIKRGQPVSREEVYSILAAGDPTLGTRITTKYGKPYHEMARGEQSNVLHEFGLAESMDQLAQLVSKREVEASQLAYIRVKPPEDAAAGAVQEAGAKGNFVARLGLAPKQVMSHTERLASQEMLQPAVAAR